MNDDNTSKYERQLDETRQLWDAEATAFDDQPDHGLRDPETLFAWTNLLKDFFPPPALEILDIGCGTGSLSLILAQFGHRVTAIDFSPRMIEFAQAKANAADQPIQFHVMDAAFPQFPPRQFDAMICRHVLWALPQPEQVLRRWADLLKDGGSLTLIEGFWHTGVGLHAKDIPALLPPSMTGVTIQDLSQQADLWDAEISDERYIVRATLKNS